LIERNHPPRGEFPLHYVPSSRTRRKRTPLEEFVPGASRGVLSKHLVLLYKPPRSTWYCDINSLRGVLFLRFLTRLQRKRTPLEASGINSSRGVLFLWVLDLAVEEEDPPSKHLVQILRRGSSSSGFLIREHSK